MIPERKDKGEENLPACNTPAATIFMVLRAGMLVLSPEGSEAAGSSKTLWVVGLSRRLPVSAKSPASAIS